MNITCSLCKNKNDFRYFVKYFKESFEDIRKNDLLKDPTKFSYAHLICSSFFTQLELVILKESMQANGAASENSNILPSAVICNGKDIKERVIDDCSVCNLPINKYILIPCAAKSCSTYFHYHCTKNKKDLARIKIVKSDGTTFKYGFFCTKHNKLMAQNNPVPLRYENFSLFKVMEELMFETDLQLQEMVFLGRDSIIEIEKDIQKTMQSFAAQLNQNSEEKNKRAQIEQKNNSHKHQNQAPSQPQKITPSVENNVNNNSSKVTFEYDTFGDFFDMVSDEEESTNIKPKTFDENVYVALSSQIKENGIETEDNKSEKPEKSQRENEKSKRDRGKGVLKDLEDIYSRVDKKEDLEGSTENGDTEAEDLNPSDKAIKNIISARHKKAAEGDYNLRREIKSNSKLNFDKNVFDYQAAPKKHQKEKQLHVSEPPRSSEEKKKWYWGEVNDGYFRKPHGDEYDLLSTTKVPNIKDVFRSELFRNLSIPNEDTKHTFHPTFDLHELRTFTKPYYNTNFDTKDSLKVLFEFKDAGIWKSPMMCYFRMKKKAQTELDLPQNLDTINEESNPKYVAVSSHKNKELKSIFNDSLKTLGNKAGYRFMEDPIDEEDLSHQKFYTLFGLKHVDYLTNEESQELKTRAMMEEELQEVLEVRENKDIDDITKEMISSSYLLYQFVVPENNSRKDRTIAKVKEEEFIQHGQVKLQE